MANRKFVICARSFTFYKCEFDFDSLWFWLLASNSWYSMLMQALISIANAIENAVRWEEQEEVEEISNDHITEFNWMNVTKTFWNFKNVCDVLDDMPMHIEYWNRNEMGNKQNLFITTYHHHHRRSRCRILFYLALTDSSFEQLKYTLTTRCRWRRRKLLIHPVFGFHKQQCHQQNNQQIESRFSRTTAIFNGLLI